MADSAPSPSDLQNLDRLSNLPEHILLHILSFLPTKDTVKTSVLSKPWQHLWTLVPAIDLHCQHCWSKTFEDTVITKVLSGNKAPILRRLRLSGRECTGSYMDKWVLSATERNVEELDLDFNQLRPNQQCYLPSTLAFHCAPESCNTLVVMKLMVFTAHNLRFVIGGHLEFPTLKVLHLNTVEFESQDLSLSSRFFPSRFPLLEELVVPHTRIYHDFNISLPKLRRLEIRCSCYEHVYALNIEAPRLQYLVLGFEGRGFGVGNLHNLIEANVHYIRVNENDEDGEFLINFINALSNVRTLRLPITMMQDLLSHSLYHADGIQHFHNLVELDLELDGSVLGIMMIMLSKFENLEHLKITEEYSKRCNDTGTQHCLVPPTHVPNCLTYHLKTFCFQEFRCLKYEMEFTIYILKNSLVLENVKILFRPTLVWKKGSHSRKILSSTSRGSLECKLKFDQMVSGYEDIDSYSDYSDYSE